MKLRVFATRVAATSLLAMGLTAEAGQAATFATLVNFNGVNGAHPGNDALIFRSDGFLYGTTGGGGATDGGTVFKLNTTSGFLTTLASPSRSVTGANSSGGVTFNAAGAIYGTAGGYGANFNQGTIFKVAPDNTISLVKAFPGFVGLNEGLTSDSHGNMFGTTDSTVFKLTTGGAVTTLATFNGTNGSNPEGQLTVDASGNIYGTTANGGLGISQFNNGFGTIFKISNTGAFSTLVDFTGLDGASPRGKLVLDRNGNLFGTTAGGSGGRLFELSNTGVLTTLTTFSANTGKTPTGGLLLDAAGNLFGTTLSGGPSNYGSVFKLSKTGVLTTLATFDGTNGMNPYAGLTADASGNLYGTTLNGGAASFGTIFKLGDTGFVPFGAPVPEPASWAVMILGFGMAGVVVRRRREDAIKTRTGYDLA